MISAYTFYRAISALIAGGLIGGALVLAGSEAPKKTSKPSTSALTLPSETTAMPPRTASTNPLVTSGSGSSLCVASPTITPTAAETTATTTCYQVGQQAWPVASSPPPGSSNKRVYCRSDGTMCQRLDCVAYDNCVLFDPPFPYDQKTALEQNR
jgi:hypothetical protein